MNRMRDQKNMTNRPSSSVGRIVRISRSKVKGKYIADEDTRTVQSPRKRHTAKADIALIYYISVASKDGGALGFHLKDNLTGLTQVKIQRGKITHAPIPMMIVLDGRPKPTLDWEKTPHLIQGDWKSTARPRSPYVDNGILFAELKDMKGEWSPRAHPVPKKYELTNIQGCFGFKNEPALLENCIKFKKVIEFRDPKHKDVWLGGVNLFGKGFQNWGVRIGNSWIMQDGEGDTKITKFPASAKAKNVLWKRIGTTSIDVKWLMKEFKSKYECEYQKYHYKTHNCQHISAAILVALGLECPFWKSEEYFAKTALSDLTFGSAHATFTSVKAVRLFDR